MTRFGRRAVALVAAVSFLALGPTGVRESAQAAVFTPSYLQDLSIPSSGSVLVTGAGGAIIDVSVKLYGLSHSSPDDIDIELVAPDGTGVALMSDDCGTTPIDHLDLTFDDAAASSLPDAGPCSSGAYRPSNANDPASPDVWPVPANPNLGSFNGLNPDGIWTLHMIDDTPGVDDGDLAQGFQITIVTAPFRALLPGQGTTGVSSPYPVALTVANRLGVVTKVTLVMKLSHESIGDLDVALQSPDGRIVWLASDACGTGVREDLVVWTFDDSAPGPLPVSGAGGACGSGTYRASNDDGGDADALPAPAPAVPGTATSLATFNGINPNGTWQLYVNDDHATGGGFLADASLNLTLSNADVLPPDTKVTMRPHKSSSHHGVFNFISTEPGSHFICKLDHQKYVPCTAPYTVRHVGTGHHRFKVRAIDAAGNVDRSPARKTWTVTRAHHHHRTS